jgi:DNA end-binding protein Ku
VRRDDRKPVDSDDIVRGFEIDKGRYVEIGDEDLDRLDIELTQSIDICDFVSLEEIDPIYYRKAYYLLPSQGAEKPYRLLVRALGETGKVGIAKVVIRNKQHLACLRTYDDYLLLETMYYPDEVRNPAQLDGDIGAARLQKAEVEMAASLVENLSESFDPEKYNDTYRKELLDLIRAKAKGRKLPEPQDEDEGEVVDLMTALRESVERTKKQRKRSSSSKKRAKAS